MLYSIHQVADMLDLHVKTVRSYVREGRLKAVRIGKQYRIAQEDLEAFTGRALPAAPATTVRRDRRVEITSIVEVTAIDPATVRRLADLTLAAVSGRPQSGTGLRIQHVYAEERGVLKIILWGGLDEVTDLIALVKHILDG